ncbi:MAG: nicotinamide riboside transporter PnuC [Armatimonadota bacterium]
MQQIWETIVKSQSAVEWVAAVTSLLCVWLTVRNNIWNWFWGFIGVILYGYIFLNYKNYANAGLQILYFLPIQFIGWYVWKRKGPNQDDDLPVTRLTTQARLGWAGVTVILTGILYVVLRFTNDPLPFFDGITTAMSIVAQYLQVHKKFENWWLWIAVDVIYAGYVFPVQQLYVSAGLYVIFTALAIVGAISWVKIMREQVLAKVTDVPASETETEPARPYA